MASSREILALQLSQNGKILFLQSNGGLLTIEVISKHNTITEHRTVKYKGNVINLYFYAQ